MTGAEAGTGAVEDPPDRQACGQIVEVVAAAIVRGGQVLAARRSRPAGLAGGWEFPGGKVEPGEQPAAALERELHEELGVHAAVGGLLGEAREGRIHLALHATTLVDGEPAVHDEHDALCWVPVERLAGLAWLPIDRRLLAAVRRHLAGPGAD